jgi:hypothetical protein
LAQKASPSILLQGFLLLLLLFFLEALALIFLELQDIHAHLHIDGLTQRIIHFCKETQFPLEGEIFRN